MLDKIFQLKKLFNRKEPADIFIHSSFIKIRTFINQPS